MRGQLDLERLVDLHVEPSVLASLNRVRVRLSLAPLDATQIRATARPAIISGRAHAAHSGRDVYGESNKALWELVVAPLAQAVEDRWGPVVGGALVEDARARVAPAQLRPLLDSLIGFGTGPRDGDHAACVAWLETQLEALGFETLVHRRPGSPAVIEARREARGLAGHVVLYGHYDCVDGGAGSWSSNPDRICERDRRLFARGIADNKGPLAARLWALGQVERSPALTWLIQGEEETGSAWSREVLRRRMPLLDADLWLEETGYHDHEDGTLRLLARTIGAEPDSSLPSDAGLERILDGLRLLAACGGLATRSEQRGLNKAVVSGGCPFNHNLPPGARYLALGVNDSRAQIHAGDESLPEWTFALHRDELALVFDIVSRLAENPA